MKPKSQRAWQALVLRERNAALNLNILALDGAGEAELRSAARIWWASVSSVLEELRVREASGLPMLPAPTEMFHSLQGMAGLLAVGTIPAPMSAVAARGKPAIGPREADHIACATAYLFLCEQGAISDPYPTATVGTHYGVQRQTVQGWKRRKISRLVMSKMDDPEYIAQTMERAGAEYRAAQTRNHINKRPPK